MKKILVAVDLQNDFIDGALGTKEAQAIVENAAKKISEHNDLIYVTYDTHFEDYADTLEGKNLPVAHCIKGTKGWQLNDRIQQALTGKKYTKVEKVTFGSVNLPKLIKQDTNGEPYEIELIGLCTDICVVSNALLLKANFPQVNVSVDANCCAGVTPELHNAALKTMGSCQIKITE
ncbi:MAG: isochorismatase family cysteine hydrolase [Acutalibacteraceae bacterium]|nr:isochorismatase family cysteine hydrolase [Acutalibacteraceae bacterium]